MDADKLLRIAAAYHGLAALALGGFPADFMVSLGMEPPGLSLWPRATGLGLGVLAVGFQRARRDVRLRAGVLWIGAAANLVTLGLLVFFVTLKSLPSILLGPAVAGLLWAWLLSGALEDDEGQEDKP